VIRRFPPIVHEVEVIGGGLAGCEAAWQLASRGIPVVLREMRPGTMTPAHRSGQLAELVCSNSLKSEALDSAQGLLKAELATFDSLILKTAKKNRVPAGRALAVDRDNFGRDVTIEVERNPLIDLVLGEVKTLSDLPLSIVATGPLTGETLSSSISGLLGEESLYFYDAIAPTVEAESIEFDRTFRASRYRSDKGDYINCPLDESEYLRFHEALVQAEVVRPRPFEEEIFFSGCIPIEEIARRGIDAPRFGPMRPVGLVDPHDGKRPFAVLQLRQEDFGETMYHMVGFQTRLRHPEQDRVFRLIPALEKARFLRYGSVHRNTFINSPRVLSPYLSYPRERIDPSQGPVIFFAGQMTGVEGYIESVTSGLMAALNVARIRAGGRPLIPPETTMMGALMRYLNETDPKMFQPMNANFGLLPHLEEKVRGRRWRREKMAERSLKALGRWKKEEGL
jgi:methylenetetrahydrofolate--tRNA-(uracil-5-)-methyltransferase